MCSGRSGIATTLCNFKMVCVTVFPTTFPSLVQQKYLNLLSFTSRTHEIKTAIRYGLDGRGLNPGRGEIFRTHPDRPWGPPSLLYNGYRVFPGGKAVGAWR